MASTRVLRAAAEALREPVDAAVLGVHRSPWFLPLLAATAAGVMIAIVALDLPWWWIAPGGVLVLAVVSLTQRQVYLARTPTRLALVRSARFGTRPSRLARVVQPGDVVLGAAGPAMRTFTVDDTTYLVSRLYSDDLDAVMEPR